MDVCIAPVISPRIPPLGVARQRRANSSSSPPSVASSAAASPAFSRRDEGKITGQSGAGDQPVAAQGGETAPMSGFSGPAECGSEAAGVGSAVARIVRLVGKFVKSR